MRRPIAVLSTAFTLGLSMVIASVSPAQANRGDRCENAVLLSRGRIEQNYGVDVEEVSKFDITDRYYSAVVDRNGKRRTVAYRFDLEFGTRTRSFMNSPVLMKSFAQEIASNCGDVAMVTFSTFSEIPQYTTFGVDRNIKMFRFRCALDNSPEQNQRPVAWGIIPFCE